MLVVIEGIDGTGKQTQTKAVAAMLRANGMTVETISFPQYTKTRGGMLAGSYLRGEFGSIDPFASAMFYALDRYESKSELMLKLGSSDVVIADRYVGSNLAHQSARCDSDDKRRELKRFIMWLEYECYKMPVPSVEILIRSTKTVSAGNRIGREYSDLHEKDTDHQSLALAEYEAIAMECGWFVVDAVKDDVQRSPEEITKEIFGTVVRERIYKTGMPVDVNLHGVASEIFGDLMKTGSPERVAMCVEAARRAVHYMQNNSKNA